MKPRLMTPTVNVLHIDDDRVFLDLVHFYFEEEFENINIDRAESPESVLTDGMLDNKDYDVIVSDYQMPGMDGLEFLASLKEKNINIPFIILTGRGREDVAIRALNLGADYYIQKQGDPEVVFSELKLYITRAVERKQAIEKLKISEERFRRMADNISEGLTIIEKMKRVYVNDRMSEITGYSKDELLGISTIDLAIPEEKKRLKSLLKELRRNNTPPGELAFWIRRKDGSLRYIQNRYSFRLPDATTSDHYIITTDITESKLVEIELRESEARYRRLFEESPISLYEEDFSDIKIFIDGLKQSGITDLRDYFDKHPEAVRHCASLGKVLDVNKATLKMVKASSKDEFLGSLDRAFNEESYIHFKEELIALSQGKTHIVHDSSSQTLKGDKLYFNLTISVLPGHEQNLSRVLVSAIDITDLKSAEEELRESDTRYRSLFENVPIGLYRTTPGGKILAANPALLKMLKYSSFKEVANMNIEKKDQYSPTYPRKDFIERIEREGSVSGLEGEWKAKDGSLVAVREYAKAIRDDFGNTIFYEGSVENITERKKVEEELQKSEERYRTLVTTMSEGIWATDRNNRTTFANPALEKMLGYSEDELLDRSVKDFLVPESKETFEKRTEERYTAGITSSTYELTFIRKDGTEFIARVSGTALYSSENEIIGTFGVVSDITKQKETENELRLFKSIIDTSNEAISISNHDLKLVYINPAHEKLFGRTYEEARQLTYRDYYPPESLEIVEREVIPVITRGESWEGVLEVYNANKRHFLLWERVDSILDPDTGKMIYLFGLMHDVTEENKYRQLLQEQKEEQELFLDIITHDLRNFQFISKSYLDLISRKDIPQDIVKLVNKSRRGVVLSSTLLNNISILMRRQLSFRYQLQTIELERAIDNVKKTLDDLYPSKNIEIIKEIASRSKIVADVLFEQLILNLLTNATKNDSNDIVRIEISYKFRENGFNELSICDHATGIHPDKREGIFEKYAEFRKTGKGSGLGLFIVKTIVDRYNWKIGIRSRDPSDYTKGTCFIIKIPIA